MARELGISAAQLYKWRKESAEFGSGSFLGNGNLKQTSERINSLEKKLKDAELELEILKKAIGIFSKSDQ